MKRMSLAASVPASGASAGDSTRRCSVTGSRSMPTRGAGSMQVMAVPVAWSATARVMKWVELPEPTSMMRAGRQRATAV